MPEHQDFANPAQERVYRRLGLLGAGPATFFRDACRLMAAPGRLATTTHLVGHLLREIEANLLDVLYEQLVVGPRAVTAQPPQELLPPPAPAPDAALASENHAPPRGDDTPPTTPRAEDAEKKDGHRTRVRAILHALAIPGDSATGRQWLTMAGGEKRLHRVAHRNRLNPPRPVTAGFVHDFDRIVELFDEILERFEARYGDVYTRLDALLARPAPGADGIRLLGEAIPNTPRTLGYFFERLEHVGWLEPLRAAGFFRALPPTEIDEEGRAFQPDWAAAHYLLRAASDRPAIVASILEEVTVEPGNVRAQARLIEVMLRLRPEDRIRLADQVKRMAPGLRRHFWGDQVVAFAAALAQDGALDSALEITALVLDLPAPDPESGKRPIRSAEYRRDREERAYDLRDAGSTLVTALREADGERTLAFFVDALDSLAGRRQDDVDADPSTPEGLQDFSRYWADDLGRRERHTTGDLRAFLTQVVVSTLRELTEREPQALPHFLRILRGRGARVLRRIELDVLATLVQSEQTGVVQAALPITVERLTERALVIEDDVAPEWSSLLGATYLRLESSDRARVLGALQPPTFPWIEDAEHLAGRRTAWRRDRLAIIADHLGPEERKELEAAIAAEGAPESLRHTGLRIATFVGPRSPLEPSVLTDMSVDQVVAFLKEWKPRAGFAEASPEGLGRQLAQLVEERSAEYAVWAPRFIGLAPTYVRSLLGGFAAAARAERPFPWPDVLELAEWAIFEGVPLVDAADAGVDADRDWREARRTVADLLGLGLARNWGEDDVIPMAERERVWRMIDALAQDPEPSPEYEERYGGTNMDPHGLAINTTRPEAIDAAIRYAFWVATRQAQSDRNLHGVLATAPEVARLLERHLDPAEDPSLAVRAAIGIWLGSLTRTDGAWVRAHLEDLLPERPEARARRDALWDTFIKWTQPHPDVLSVLEPYYRAGVVRTGTERETRDHGKEADDRLAEHLMTLYWWGALDLSDPESLIHFFFAHADAALRRHAIYFAGFSLFHAEKPVDQVPLERLRQLWEWRLPQLEAAITASTLDDGKDRAAARAELEEFGWWFAAGAFDPAWALIQLHQVLLLTGGIELDHAVAERLAELAGEHPGAAVRCLAAVDFSGGGQPWNGHGWLEHARTIAVVALRNESAAVRAEARAVVNKIVAAGYLEYRELLDEHPPY